MANNQGGVRDVSIVSGDGYGPVGLDLGYSDEQGPCLIKNVRVVGFDVGVRTAHSVASVVMEKAYLRAGAGISDEAPMFRFEDGAAPVVSVERLSTDFSFDKSFLVHASRRTLVMRYISCNFLGARGAYSNSGTGPLFIEDVVINKYRFKNQSVWARQLNVEQVGTRVENDGGTLWALGMKVETGGTVVETKNGGQTEILGGLTQTNNGKLAPMFVSHESNVSVTFAEVNNSDDPFVRFAVETRSGETKEWGDANVAFKGFRPIVYESRAAPVATRK